VVWCGVRQRVVACSEKSDQSLSFWYFSPGPAQRE